MTQTAEQVIAEFLRNIPFNLGLDDLADDLVSRLREFGFHIERAKKP
jgi:hypothetical protein